MTSNSAQRRRLLQMLMASPFLASCLRQQRPVSTPKALKGDDDKRFLFVFTAVGGASINDAFMARRYSEVGQPSILNVFPDQMVKSFAGSDLRAVDYAADSVGALPFAVKSAQSRFVGKHLNDIMVAQVNGTAVAHPLAQYRSVTGFDAWNGRTLQEAVAAHYGKGLLLPNINMGTVGYAEHGTDPTLPFWAKAEVIADPAFFPFSLHGHKGINGAPDASLIGLARRVRDEKLEPRSAFMQSFGQNPLLQQWLMQRKKTGDFEASDAINTLNAFETSSSLPFKNFGLEPNADGGILREAFDQLGPDPLHNQALLAYLAITKGLSCTATFGLSMNVTIDGSDEDNPKLTNPPTAFDYSHNAHRSTQALLWNRMFDILDRLIGLLKITEYKDGESYWDRSMIYIATDFGRDKKRKENLIEFPTGHDTNNAVAIISPMANGGKVLGGVKLDDLSLYGFDPQSGVPKPGTEMTERQIYAGILHALGVPTEGSGLPDMRAMRKNS